MYPNSYYPNEYFPVDYFSKVGGFAPGGGGYYPGEYFPCNYFATDYWPAHACPPFPPVPPTPTVSAGGASSGHPWPERLVNILLPKRVIQDDEEFLLIIDD